MSDVARQLTQDLARQLAALCADHDDGAAASGVRTCGAAAAAAAAPSTCDRPVHADERFRQLLLDTLSQADRPRRVVGALGRTGVGKSFLLNMLLMASERTQEEYLVENGEYLDADDMQTALRCAPCFSCHVTRA